MTYVFLIDLFFYLKFHLTFGIYQKNSPKMLKYDLIKFETWFGLSNPVSFAFGKLQCFWKKFAECDYIGFRHKCHLHPLLLPVSPLSSVQHKQRCFIKTIVVILVYEFEFDSDTLQKKYVRKKYCTAPVWKYTSHR